MVSPYLNHFIQPDTIVPDPSNPQNFNRFGYVLNNPVNFNDPTGHEIGTLCDRGYCNENDDPIMADSLDNIFFKPKPKPKQEKGEESQPTGYYCEIGYGCWHDNVTDVSGTQEDVVIYASLAIACFVSCPPKVRAIMINVGISVGVDYSLVTVSGGTYSHQRGLKVAGYSLIMGSLSGGISDYIGYSTSSSWLRNYALQSTLQIVGNTGFRRSENQTTTLLNVLMDFGGATFSTSIQTTIPGDINVLSHYGEATTSMFGSFPGLTERNILSSIILVP